MTAPEISRSQSWNWFSRSEASLCLSALFLLPLSLLSPDSYVYFWVQSELRSHFPANFIKNKVYINYLQPFAARLAVNPPFLDPGPGSVAYLWNSSVPWQSFTLGQSRSPAPHRCVHVNTDAVVPWSYMTWWPNPLAKLPKKGSNDL